MMSLPVVPPPDMLMESLQRVMEITAGRESSPGGGTRPATVSSRWRISAVNASARSSAPSIYPISRIWEMFPSAASSKSGRATGTPASFTSSTMSALVDLETMNMSGLCASTFSAPFS